MLGRRVSFSLIRKLFEGFGWQPTLTRLAGLAASFCNLDGDTEGNFGAVVAKTLSKLRESDDSRLQGIGRHFSSNTADGVLTEDGLYVMMALALMYGTDSDLGPTDESIALLALLLNDYIGTYLTDAGMPKKEALAAKVSQGYRFRDRGDVRVAIARSYAIYTRAGRHPKAVARQREIERHAFDTTFQAYFSSIAVPLALVASTWHKEGAVLDIGSWASQTKLDPSWVRERLQTMVGDREVLKAELFKTAPFGYPFDAERVLSHTPFIRVSGDIVIGASPRLVAEHLKIGIWDRFRRGYQRERLGGTDWLSDFGVKFEEWCRELARRAGEKSPHLRVDLSEDIGSEDEIEDIVIEGGSGVAFFACKARLVPVKARTYFSPKKMAAWLNEVLLAPRSDDGKQRGGAITLFARKFDKLRARAARVGKLPVLAVVLFESVGDTSPLQEWIDVLRVASGIRTDMGRVQIMTVTEFEILMGVAEQGGDPVDIMLKKQNDEVRAGMPIDWYAYQNGAHLALPGWIREQNQRIFDDTLERLFRDGTPGREE